MLFRCLLCGVGVGGWVLVSPGAGRKDKASDGKVVPLKVDETGKIKVKSARHLMVVTVQPALITILWVWFWL
jgi:hypothetical protein